MEDKKISAMPVASSLDGTETIPIVKDGYNAKTAVDTIVDKARDGLVEQVSGKGLSTNDYTDADKQKLGALPTNVELTNKLATKQDALTTSEEFSISPDNKLSLTDVAKMQNFIDRWNEAWKIDGVQYGKYDPDNAPDAFHPFMGNDVWMTYEEALDVWEYSVHEPFTNLSGAFTNVPCRTFLPLPYRSVNYRGAISLKGMCARNENVEAVNVRVIKASDLFDAFAFAKKLKKVVGIIDVSEITNVRNFWYFTDGALVLSEISLKGLKVGISMWNNPLLSLASLQYLIANAANTATITVTVHKDVYAKLTGDTTNAAAAALSTEEAAQWQQVVTDAAAKKISFATV